MSREFSCCDMFPCFSIPAALSDPNTFALRELAMLIKMSSEYRCFEKLPKSVITVVFASSCRICGWHWITWPLSSRRFGNTCRSQSISLLFTAFCGYFADIGLLGLSWLWMSQKLEAGISRFGLPLIASSWSECGFLIFRSSSQELSLLKLSWRDLRFLN